MTLLLVMVSLLLISNVVWCQGEITIPATDSLIEYTGRIDFTDPAAPRFAYPGVSVRAAFIGTSISVILDDEWGFNYYNVILDGVVLSRLQPSAGTTTYSVATHLVDTVHEIELFKLTEQDFGKTSFNGFVISSDRAIVPLSNKRTRLIEFIGNSVTCGYGNEGALGQVFSGSTQNHYMTYAALTSRNFTARHLAVAKSGIGIYRNYDGPPHGDPDCMPNLYPRIFLWEDSPQYIFQPTPDLICIELGTNDFSTGGGDSDRFVSHYLSFIDTLQSRYVSPDIICLLGPLLNAPFVRPYFQTILDVANSKGKGTVHFFEMSHMTGDLGIGTDYHPTVAQHMKNGLELTEYIRTLKGWDVVPVVTEASVVTKHQVRLDFNTQISSSAGDYTGFAIRLNRVPVAIAGAHRDSIDARVLYLRLSQEIGIGDTVLLNYQPGSVSGSGTTKLNYFTGLSVRNSLKPTELANGEIYPGGRDIILRFNKPIQPVTELSGFSVVAGDGGHPVDGALVTDNGLLLHTTKTILSGDVVSISYSGTDIVGKDDIVAAPFFNIALWNGSLQTTGVDNAAGTPHEFALRQNYPNPFNPTTVIPFDLAATGAVSMTVFDVLGQNIATLVNEVRLPGSYEVVWDASGLGGGVYYCRLSAGGTVRMTKMVLMR